MSETCSTAPFSPDVLIIDINALAYAAMYEPAVAKLQVNGQSTAALHAGLASVFKLIKENPLALPVIVWDSKPAYRLGLYPQYKANRSGDPVKDEIREKYRQQRPHMQKLLSALGLPQLTGINVEADDLAGRIHRSLRQCAKTADWQIQLCTKDSDWIQCIDEQTLWFRTAGEHSRTISLQDIRNPDVGIDKKGENYESVALYVACKSLAGDASDNIPGIEGIGMKTAAKFIREYGSIEAVWEAFDQGQIKKVGAKLAAICSPQARELYALNCKLVDWAAHPPIESKSIVVRAFQSDMEEFNAVCDEFSLKSNKARGAEIAPMLSQWNSKWSDFVCALESFDYHVD